MSLDAHVASVKSILEDSVVAPSISLAATSEDAGLAAGTLNVRVSVLTRFGETLPCARVSLAVSAKDVVTVSISRVNDSKGYRVYASMASAAETFQVELKPFQDATGTVVIASVSTGSAMPTEESGTLFLSQAQYEQSSIDALAFYSSRFPQKLSSSITTAASETSYTLPNDWVEGFSSLLEVQYPASDFPPSLLEIPRQVYTKEGELLFVGLTPSDEQEALLTFLAPHTYGVLDSFSVQDSGAVDLLAASFACERIANTYAHNTNRMIAADVVDYENRPRAFRELANTYRLNAYRMLNLDEKGNKSGAATASWSNFMPANEFLEGVNYPW